MRNASFPLIGLCLAVLLAACNSDDSGPGIDDPIACPGGNCAFEDAQQIDGHPATLATVVSHVPGSSDVLHVRREDFQVDGQPWSFVLVGHENGADCEACSPAQVCAVADDDESLLFSARWSNLEERPKTLQDECPERALATSGNTVVDCPRETSGQDHSLVDEAAFGQFVETQAEGEFGDCFR